MARITGPGRLRARARLGRATAIGAALALALATPLLAGVARAAPASTAATGISIGLSTGTFGRMLVAASGPYAGYTLYDISSDYGGKYGCTNKVENLVIGPYQCTGPETDSNAEWPALTTPGKPVAVGGVSQAHLGDVFRPGVGLQVTYYGHPLYLFDQFPTLVSGEGWFEPGLPPDHGDWWVVAANGTAVPWAMTLGETVIGGKERLAALMTDGGNEILFPAYAYTNGTNCTGACAAAFPPVISQGRPGLLDGIDASDVGSVTRADGTTQLTWNGRPLYFDGANAITVGPSGFKVAGNGDGASDGGGTFHLIINP